MKELVGKTIVALFVNQDSTLLKFVCNDGSEVIYYAEGDCCSETWFADISVDWGLFDEPRTVLEVEELDIPDWPSNVITKDGRSRQDVDTVYGYTIKTNRSPWGVKTLGIVFRNSSNGYYGGWVELVDVNKGYYADHWSRVVADSEWKQIKEDWTSQ